jgi:hypothetical protein
MSTEIHEWRPGDIEVSEGFVDGEDRNDLKLCIEVPGTGEDAQIAVHIIDPAKARNCEDPIASLYLTATEAIIAQERLGFARELVAL